MESPTSKYCPIKEVPFRGVNCSDAAGHELNYGKITQYLNANATLTGRRWDKSMQTPYFNIADKDGVTHQIWYDDPESCTPKYQLAREHGLRGTGPYTLDFLNYTTALDREQAAAMWAALHEFMPAQ
jgi:di-N-acetylchitobiase